MPLKKVHKIFERFKKNTPFPKTELHYETPFELLIAVILSAQSTDKSVNKATDLLFEVARTPEQILALGELKLIEFIKTIGLFKNKAKYILLTCQILVDRFQSTVPESREALESLPGVGRKTANVILNTVFNKPVVAVDTHVFRVSHRIGLTQARTLLDTERDLMKRIPHPFKREAHHWLVLHGRYICTAKMPKCGQCFLMDLCDYKRKEI